ncbi:MAG: B12-binding domain-containing radical SAM protein, partial [Candidatus Thorarchaeota archaeon]
MRVVLVATHQISMDYKIPLYRCLGILALASALREESIDCDVLDLSKFHNLSTSDLETVMTEIIDMILDAKPDIFGLSTMSNNLPLALEIAKRLKEQNSDLIVIFGGPGVSFLAQETMESFPFIDAVVRGEADRVFPKYIKDLTEGDASSVPGLVHRVSSDIVDHGWPKPIDDLDELPIPLYSSCSKQENEESTIYLEVGRGCPFNCTFCSTSQYFKRKYRMKSPQRVIKEISLVQNILDAKTIAFSHDLFTLNKDYVIALCQSLKEHQPPIKWGCSSRLDTLDTELLKHMSEAGCYGIFLGIEVGTPAMQERINQKLDLSRLLEVV